MKTTQQIVDDIVAQAPGAAAPADLAARYNAFATEHCTRVQDLRLILLVCAAGWIEEGRAAGIERELLDRAAGSELTLASAFVINAMKRRAGEPLSPARFALVAYELAERVTSLPSFDEAAAEADSLVAMERGT